VVKTALSYEKVRNEHGFIGGGWKKYHLLIIQQGKIGYGNDD
jgi:hypothetical protein